MSSERKNPVVEIRRVADLSLSGIPYDKIAREILGGSYQLSLVMCGDALARRLNRTYRKNKHAANVLSFPLYNDEGEIFLNVYAARREAKRFGITLRSHLMLLFIHGCLHLASHRHGKEMEQKERLMLRKYMPRKGKTKMTDQNSRVQ